MKEIFKRHPRYRVAPEEFASVPENLWVRCPRCRELLYTKELESSMHVCSKCKYHFPLTARQRLEATLDPGTFREFDSALTGSDPLHFKSPDQVYADKLRQYAENSGSDEAFIFGIGQIDEQDAVVGATEFKFCGGSMGAAFGEKVVRAFELAQRENLPLIIFSTSGGARMQEGAVSLLQMAKTVAALQRFHESALPFISVMVDPCLGGVTASYAMLGDVNIAEPGAYIGFAGRRVIEQTMRQRLPSDAATAEFLLQHGMLDMIVPRSEMRNILGRLIRMYVALNPAVRKKELVEQLA